jgi:uncharacterized protein YyaL (SSP411 family)
MTPGSGFLRTFRASAFAIVWLGLSIGAPAQGGRLSEATNPYLLMHAEDAIDWHPWGERALERARQENKLIFLSIGYASCHWCHVLARTTFADQRVVEMLNARMRRDAPRRDDKVLTSWNALAVSTFAKAAQVLDDRRYLKVAEATIRPLLPSQPRRLRHSRRAGKTAGAVFLDDYAFLVQALLDLYETDFQASRLDGARMLMETLIERFQDEPGMPFRFTPIGHSSDIPVQTILNEEGAPSGNAAALIALRRLVLFGAEAAFEAQTRALSRGLGSYLEASAPSAAGLLRAPATSTIQKAPLTH